MNLASRFAEAVRQFPDRSALSDDEGTLTYRQWDERARAVAHYLVDSGLAPGDRVALYLPNSADGAVMLYAVWIAGGVAVPLNYRFSEADLAFALSDSGSRVLMAEGRDVPRLLSLLPASPVRHLVVRGAESEGAPAPVGLDVVRLAAVAAEPQGLAIAPRRDGDDCLLMYTSGTTGRPKGVRQTHRNNTAAVDMVASAWELGSGDRLLQALPLFHVGGLQCTTLPALAVGAEARFLPRWQAEAWLLQAGAFRPTFSALVTTMLIDVLRTLSASAPLAPPASPLRFIVFGGSATPPHVPDRLEALLHTPIIELYGQTETSGLITTYSAGERRVRGSMGRVRQEVAEAVLLTAEGNLAPLSEGATGELAFAGDIVAPGYWQAPEETARRRVGPYLRTGDVVSVGADGYLTYLDRADNMIVSGGENIYPSEVEAALLRHPAVREAAVIGTPHERLVQQVTAVVVPADGSNLSAADLGQFLAADGQLAAFKRPRRVEFATALPKTGSGKVDRGALKKQYAK